MNTYNVYFSVKGTEVFMVYTVFACNMTEAEQRAKDHVYKEQVEIIRVTGKKITISVERIDKTGGIVELK